MRTWDGDGRSHLWQVDDPGWLLSVQGTGQLSRTMQSPGRFREVGLLLDDPAGLLLQPRFPGSSDAGRPRFDARSVRLSPAGRTTEQVGNEFYDLLGRAVHHCVQHDEYLVVERGGWDAPDEPYCLFLLSTEADEVVSVVETAPQAMHSPVWAANPAPGRRGQTMTAPADAETLGAVPELFFEAIVGWGIQPWDLALTFGPRGDA